MTVYITYHKVYTMNILKKVKKYNNILFPLTAAALIIIIWAAAAALTGKEIILPQIDSVAESFIEIIKLPQFYQSVLYTLLRTFISFVAAFSLALILAALSAIYKPLYKFLSPFILLLRATPTISIILISLIWFKSFTAPMFIAFLIIFPALYAAIYGAIVSVDGELIQMSNVYRVSNFNMVKKLYIPSVLPAVLYSVKANISLNLKIIIASEVLAQTSSSIGLNMQISKIYLDTPVLFAWTIAAIILSYLLEVLVDVIRKNVIRWKA